MVALEGVSRVFGDVTAVHAATFSLAAGEFMTIVGPSGCGKTTLLRMIAGFDAPSAGTIRLDGEDVARLPPYRRSIGMVFQRLALFPHMTAADNVAYPLRMRRFPITEIPERVARYLALVRLDGLGTRRPHELSGGQQQRVAIARALSFGPDLLLLDEPLSALDRQLREDMQLEFRRIQQELGVSTINVTHDQREALVMSDRVVVMDGGRVQQSGTPGEVYRTPRTAFVASFIGTTSTLPGELVAREGERCELRIGERTVSARDPSASLAVGDAVEGVLRAERVRLSGEAGVRTDDDVDDGSDALSAKLEQARHGTARTAIEGRVAQCVYEGDRLVYAVLVPAFGGRLLFAVDTDPAEERRHPTDAVVSLDWATDELLAFPARAGAASVRHVAS